MKGKTKEERFLLRLYEMAHQLGDIYSVIDRFDVGNAIGLHPRGITTISNQLAQTNFIKKIGASEIHLTPHGEKLVQELTDE